jgi:3-oxoacyl-[acyl-carrier-protein] synthase I
MSAQELAVLKTGLVTAVGLTAPAACAAIRAKLTNPVETRFLDRGGQWITGYPVPLAEPERGGGKLARMAASAAAQCLADIPKREWPSVALQLCVAEKTRPGREEGFDDQLRWDIERHLETRFASVSIVAKGRTSIGTALIEARRLIFQQGTRHVLIVAADSLLEWPALGAYERAKRVLTSENSNGFIPGEAAAAILVGQPSGQAELLCVGVGFGTESATLDSDQPLRADGLVEAIRGALAEAGCGLHDIDLRIADLSGEQYYFKEAALALTRILRQRKDELDLWHAAECTGEVGAAAGAIALAVAEAACRKAYAPGPAILLHASNDDGERTAAVLSYGVRS